MTERYRFDPARGRFTVQGFAAGLLSAFAHNPTFAVRRYDGELRFEGGRVEGMGLKLNVRADSLDLLDKLKPSDRREIEERMRRDVLEIAEYPEINYEGANHLAEPVAPGEFRIRIDGRLTLHGETRPLPIDAALQFFKDGIAVRGEGPLRLSDYGIKPVIALGGAIKLKDELHVAFDVFAIPEGP